MRIAMISEHASPLADLGGPDGGGQNVYVGMLARHLGRMGHAVDVFTRAEDATTPEVTDFAPGVRVVQVAAGPVAVLPKERLLPFMPAFADAVERFMRDGPRPDVIHAHFFMSGLVGLTLKQRLGVPLAVTFHALGRVRRLHQKSEDGFPDERFAIEDRLVREADLIVAECPQDEEDLRTLYGAEPARMAMVPCGFDADEFAPMERSEARRRLGLPPTGTIVLQLGRMVPRKGVDNVICGFAHGLAEHPDARLLVVGGADDAATATELARLRGVAAAEGVATRVHFAGARPRDELRLYYAAADMFATTPWYEPFGITPLEAMACARPVIGADVGGIKYSVADGETGLLVPPHDPHALGAAMAQLADDPARGDAMGQAGLERVRAMFTWEGVAAAMAGLYRGLVPASGGRPAVFLDKDGTLIVDVPYNVDPARIRLAPGARAGAAALHAAGYALVVVTNQSGAARGLFPEAALEGVERRLRALLAPTPIAGFFHCPHHPDGRVPALSIECGCRKPLPGMLHAAARALGLDLARSWMVGDILNDVEAGGRAGCRTVLIDNGNETEWLGGPHRTPDRRVPDMGAAARVIIEEDGHAAERAA